MKTLDHLTYLLLVGVFAVLNGCTDQQGTSGLSADGNAMSPHLQTTDGITRLFVNGKPFLSLAGELHNSSSSNLEYMEPIWPKLAQMNLNTVLAGVSWELIEPVEGQFNFELVDGLIKSARENDLKIVFLWFGSWKNMVSSYAPEWVKNDPERFPLLVAQDGEKFQMLSTCSTENMHADARAFAALMRHIKQVDSDEQTVIMMQVQNEVGTSGGERDHSELANDVYYNQVPENLMNYLEQNKANLIPEFEQVWAENGYKMKGNWEEVFGEGMKGNEIFMAWQLSSYIGEVIKAGKKEYNIPMFVNASVGRQDQKIGTYPSGGPVAFVMDVWRAGAPELDILSPDIYFGDFNRHCRLYTQSGNPLFIPETRAGELGAARALIAFGNFNAIGFSPFGIDGRITESINERPLFRIYDILDQLSPLILSSEANKQMIAAVVDENNPSASIEMGRYTVDFNIQSRRFQDEDSGLGYALLIEEGKEEFIVAGKNITVQFSLTNRTDQVTGIASAEEGKFDNGTWIPGRRLNGDAIMVSYSFADLYREGKSGHGLNFRNLNIIHVRLYNY